MGVLTMNKNTWNAIEQMVGSWEGSGSGEFPTIDDFTYRERLTVSVAAAGKSLHYRQETWRTNVDPPVGSHVETGFISVIGDGEVEVLNAQGHDRTEVLRGAVNPTETGFHLSLRSTSLAHDDRMVASWRTWVLDGEVLTYTMGMRTTSTLDGAPHLAAGLRRSDTR